MAKMTRGYMQESPDCRRYYIESDEKFNFGDPYGPQPIYRPIEVRTLCQMDYLPSPGFREFRDKYIAPAAKAMADAEIAFNDFYSLWMNGMLQVENAERQHLPVLNVTDASLNVAKHRCNG